MSSRRLSIVLASLLMTLPASSAYAIFHHHHNRPVYAAPPPMAPAPAYVPYPVAQPCPPQPCAPVPQCQPVCQPACVPYNPCMPTAPVAAPTAAYYAPQVAYKTVWQKVPTTTYRPVAGVDGCGCPTTTLAPCTSMAWQAQRVAYRPLFPNLARWFNRQPVAPTYGYAPAYSAGYAPAYYDPGYALAGYAGSGCSSCGISAAYAPAYSGCSSCSQGYAGAPGCSSCQGGAYSAPVAAPAIAPGPTSLSPTPGPAVTPVPAETRPALPSYTVPPAGTTPAPAPAVDYSSSVPDLELSKPAVASPARRPTELKPIDDLDAEKIRGIRPVQPRVNDTHADRTANSQPGAFRLPSQATPIVAGTVQPASAVDAKPAVEKKPASKWDREFEPIR